MSTSRLRTRAAVGAVAAALSVGLFAGPGTASANDPKDCADFSTQRQAQRWFKQHNPNRDPAGLDADNDGRACEDLP